MGNWIGRLRLALASAIAPRRDDEGDSTRRLSARLDSARLETARLREQLALTGRRLSAFTDHLPAIVAQFDLAGRFMFVNAYINTVLPQAPEQLLGVHLRDIVGDVLYDSISASIDQACGGEPVAFELCYPVDGVERHFAASYRPEFDEDGAVRSVFALFLDITERKQVELRQAADELRLRTITDNLPILISYVNRDLRFEFCNATFLAWFGLHPAQLLGRSLLDVMNDDTFLDDDVVLVHLARAQRGEHVEFEIEVRSDGVQRWLHHHYVPQIGADGSLMGIFLMCSDVTQLKLVQRKLSELARLDDLTGLPNRYQLTEKMEEAANRCNRAAQPMGLLFLDIDHFKQVNDTLGHSVGDEVLSQFAQRLRAAVRQTDIVARLAGDEFVIVLEALAERATIGLVAEKILLAMQAPMVLSRGELIVSCSIGGAVALGPGIVPKLLLECADHALYDAKNAGRATYRLRNYSAVAQGETASKY